MGELQACRQSPSIEAEAADLVKALGGVWESRGAMCRCPAHDDRNPSLSVRVGRQSLLFKCFAGCSASDVLRAIRRLRLDIPEWRSSDRSDAEWSQPMADRAREIWASARAIDASPAERYLAARGLRFRSPALRFHPRTPLGRGRAVTFRPALIAAIRDHSTLVAIQRIFLDPGGDALACDIAQPKRILGRPLGGAVKLAPAETILGLAEGIETALSAQMLLDLPVWAVLGNERLAHVAVPERVTRLLLLADNDAAGRRAAARARRAHNRPGRTIQTLWPPRALNDWNDVLMAGGKEAGFGMRQAA